MASRLRRIRDWLAPPLPVDPPATAENPEALRRAVRLLETAARRRLRDGLAGEFRSAFRGSGIEIDDLRPYAPGDDVRDIDWRATARRPPQAGPVARRYVEERARTVLFLLDASGSMGFGRGGASVHAFALELLAPLAFAAADAGDRVGLIAFDSAARRIVPPGAGRRRALRAVREALAQPPAGGTALADAFATADRLLRRRGVVFILSDFLADAADDWAPALSRLASRNDVIAAALADPAGRPIAVAPISRWAGMEGGGTATFAGPGPPPEDPRRRGLEARIRRTGAEPLLLETGDDWIPPLLAIMRRRRLR